VLDEQVGLVDALTPAVRLGPWPGRAFASITLAALLFAGVRSRRGRSVVRTSHPDAPDSPDQEMSLT